jgi:hypothetical protein
MHGKFSLNIHVTTLQLFDKNVDHLPHTTLLLQKKRKHSEPPYSLLSAAIIKIMRRIIIITIRRWNLLPLTKGSPR